MVEIDSGARAAARRGSCVSRRLAAAPARGAGLAAHTGRPLEGRLQTCLSRAQQAKLVCVSSR